MKRHDDSATLELPGFAAAPTYRQLGANFRERERVARKVKRWQARLLQMAPIERQAIIAALEAIACGNDAGLLREPAPAPKPQADDDWHERRWQERQRLKELHRAPWCKDSDYVIFTTTCDACEEGLFGWYKDTAHGRRIRCQHCGHERETDRPPNKYRAHVLRTQAERQGR